MTADPEQKAFAEIIALAQEWSGCHWARYNPNTLKRRVARRMIDVRCQAFEQYLNFLTLHPEEFPRLMAFLTIKVSCFFRDPEVFSCLTERVFHKLFQDCIAEQRPILRIWSAACAYGEEAYSLAIAVQEYLHRENIAALPVTILATDLDPNALTKASEGIYDDATLVHLPDAIRTRYFLKPSFLKPGLSQVTPELRQMVNFVSFDLSSSSRLAPTSGIFVDYDLILCRNMLIYCQHRLKIDILKRLHACLRPRGCLVLGRSESIPEELKNHFAPLDRRFKIFTKEEVVP